MLVPALCISAYLMYHVYSTRRDAEPFIRPASVSFDHPPQHQHNPTSLIGGSTNSTRDSTIISQTLARSIIPTARFSIIAVSMTLASIARILLLTVTFGIASTVLSVYEIVLYGMEDQFAEAMGRGAGNETEEEDGSARSSSPFDMLPSDPAGNKAKYFHLAIPVFGIALFLVFATGIDMRLGVSQLVSSSARKSRKFFRRVFRRGGAGSGESGDVEEETGDNVEWDGGHDSEQQRRSSPLEPSEKHTKIRGAIPPRIETGQNRAEKDVLKIGNREELTDGDDKELVQALENAFTKPIDGSTNGQPADFVKILPVSPHGRMIPPLNALTTYAVKSGFKQILFQSLEVVPAKEEIAKMADELDEETLVVGKAFNPHNFNVGEQDLNGLTTPWNTLALWNAEKLAMTGFLLISEGIVNGVVSATEEAAVISLNQLLRPTVSRAKLVRTRKQGMQPGDDGWLTNWHDEDRQKWHAKKMATKVSSVRDQHTALNLPAGKVLHVDRAES
ncbi:hypothetical protein HK102_004821 [Quaeritorhiza haematococci]|nr:hypothetical protein HK102_004821 [Quaeritorhiza haematococci]